MRELQFEEYKTVGSLFLEECKISPWLGLLFCKVFSVVTSVGGWCCVKE